jgi:hypothetical protein
MWGIVFAFSVTAPLHAQTTQTIAAAPFQCINQTSFYCANVPVTIDALPGHMYVDLFGSLSYGYVSMYTDDYSVSTYFNNLTIVKGPLDANGHFTSLQIGLGDQGVLNLIVTWQSYSSGRPQGTHNVIWRPTISTSSTTPSTFTMD